MDGWALTAAFLAGAGWTTWLIEARRHARTRRWWLSAMDRSAELHERAKVAEAELAARGRSTD